MVTNVGLPLKSVSFVEGQAVFVPNSLVGRVDARTAVGRYEIVEVGSAGNADAERRRSVRVALRPDENPDDGWVASSRLHEGIGITLVRVGDLATETDLLDPLTKSIAHYLRLLVGHDYFHLAYLRTIAELRNVWAQRRGGTTHLVFVGHGREDAIQFVPNDAAEAPEWLSGAALATLLDAHGANPRVNVLSLACLTGRAAFAKSVSNAGSVRSCSAPLHEVHGAIASQFVQTVFAEHLLQGRTWQVALRLARSRTPGTGTFRCWQEGALQQGASG